MTVYDSVPHFESEHYLLRFIQKEDVRDLCEVYGDKHALPFFNSDNCHGDNFYYPTMERMEAALDFWLKSYETKWFVRWTIVDKAAGKAVGTVELFHREADDYFNHTGVLRLDVKSDYEQAAMIAEIAGVIVPPAYSLFATDRIITKVPLYAVERMAAFEKMGFKKSEEFLYGPAGGYAYKDYWERRK